MHHQYVTNKKKPALLVSTVLNDIKIKTNKWNRLLIHTMNDIESKTLQNYLYELVISFKTIQNTLFYHFLERDLTLVNNIRYSNLKKIILLFDYVVHS